MSGWFRFVTQSLFHPQQVGAICASSRFMGKTMTDAVGIEQARSIVELGPGDGAFTRVILERMAPEARLMAIEINPEFADILKRKYPNVRVKTGCVSRISEMLKEEEMPPPEVVVSALPWSVFQEELQDRLLPAVVEAMAPGGKFTTIAYISGLFLTPARRFRTKLENLFESVERSPVQWLNLPPAIAYRCSKSDDASV
jgi:phospholipid N-methyltransferase